MVAVILDHSVELVVPIHPSLCLGGMLFPGHLNAALIVSINHLSDLLYDILCLLFKERLMSDCMSVLV